MKRSPSKGLSNKKVDSGSIQAQVDVVTALTNAGERLLQVPAAVVGNLAGP